MRVVKDLKLEILGTNSHYFRLDEFNEDSETDILVYGYNFVQDSSKCEGLKKYVRKVYLNYWMPTEFCGKVSTTQDSFFDEVYGICPYSVKWLNEITNSKKYKTICYPFNLKDIPQNKEKIYDVCYHGGLHGDYHLRCLDIMRNFNYRYVSMTHDINPLTRSNLKYATNLDLTNEEKFNLISQCKISIVYNYFPVRNSNDVNNIKGRDKWHINKAFNHIDDLKIIPQFKSRVNEAAISKTLNLVQRDSWNVIEYFYTPDVDFIYFDSNEELGFKISEILLNWDNYNSMIENAYQKSLNYSTEKLYAKIKNEKNEN